MATDIVTESVDDTTTDVDLDTFSNEFFGTTPVEKAVDDVAPEDVPSETQDNDDEGDDAPDPADTPDDKLVDEPADNEEDDDDAETEEEEETPLFKVKRKKSVGERIREITAARHEAERRTEELERLLAEATAAKSEDPKPKAAPSVALEADAPDPDETLDDGAQKYPLGEFDPKYIRDLTRFTIKVEREAAKVEETQRLEESRMQEAEQALASQWTEKLTVAKEALPDLGEKAAVLENTFRSLDPHYGKYLAATIMSMDKGPEVLHYLATNISEAQKIVASGPTSATLALGRIEARFDTTEKARNEKPRPSKAPTPPPTNRGSGGKFSVAPDTDDLDAFEKSFFLPKR